MSEILLFRGFDERRTHIRCLNRANNARIPRHLHRWPFYANVRCAWPEMTELAYRHQGCAEVKFQSRRTNGKRKSKRLREQKAKRKAVNSVQRRVDVRESLRYSKGCHEMAIVKWQYLVGRRIPSVLSRSSMQWKAQKLESVLEQRGWIGLKRQIFYDTSHLLF